MPAKLNEQFVKNKLLSLDFELQDRYKNSYTKLNIKCLRHNAVYKTIVSSLFQGQRLMCCASEVRRTSNSFTIQEVADICKSFGFEFMGGTWNGSKNKYSIKCLNHNEIHEVVWDKFLNNKSIRCCWL